MASTSVGQKSSRGHLGHFCILVVSNITLIENVGDQKNLVGKTFGLRTAMPGGTQVWFW